ncbi:hypothetical protein [Cyanobium sp. N5-Cardenillas]|uniref:hypothetical protein n=1 Tax=Cyanobium sp. N5-Cardenillas TaxID=2823720 RepID=UPI0020CEF7CF|nr:hypothetical protein [Cyanobium sp. N5-Cardenillas]MCP9786772.1 hypothetical protein [Cyanobium sp. N5-Cardenillas]
MKDFSQLGRSGIAAGLSAARKLRQGLDGTGSALSVAAGAVAASLSELNNIGIDPQMISRLSSAATNHGVAAADLLAKLPGELEHFGTSVVDQFLRGGDSQGKHWSHLESQANAPQRSSDPTNAIWEDGSANVFRGATDMSWTERAQASFDNHFDGLIAAAQTPEFWQRTLGNAMEASVYAAAITAVDQLLIHRDELINGTLEARRERLIQILQTSGLMAAGALPVSVFLALALMLVPGLTLVMGPLGLIGTAGLGFRLISSAVRNPSQQERQVALNLQGLLLEKFYALQRDDEGCVTITVRALPGL